MSLYVYCQREVEVTYVTSVDLSFISFIPLEGLGIGLYVSLNFIETKLYNERRGFRDVPTFDIGSSRYPTYHPSPLTSPLGPKTRKVTLTGGIPSC